ncbi:MAG: RcgR family putative quorum lactone hydrolase [Pyrinomonadaceae bacterium]
MTIRAGWQPAFPFMLKRYMHNRERYLAMLDNNRVVHPFDWGTEFITTNANGSDPRKLFSAYSKKMVAQSDDFFYSPEISDFKFLISDLKSGFANLAWTSGIETPSKENNTAYASFFPCETNRKAAILVLPHWNAKAGTYFDLCNMFNKVGLSALRLTLPYHEERKPPEINRADYLVAPNVGRTLQSLRQAVVDTRSAVSWLKQQGYEKIGIVGTSIGSCVGFFAFTHDMQIDAAVFNHVSGYPADVVWHGLSAYHVKEGIGNNLTLDELREYWLPISPMAYIERLAKLPPRPQRYIYTLYDLSFPVNLSRDTINALRKHKIRHSKTVIPCGHYTLGQKPWVYYDGFKIVSFLRKHLR